MVSKTKSQIGKASRAAGGRFELKVRKDLESKGWIVSKWMNNVEFSKEADKFYEVPKGTCTLLVPAKHKFRGPGIPMAIGTGFPDFIAYKVLEDVSFDSKGEIYPDGHHNRPTFTILGIEAKSNGYLTKEEKEKCKWMLDNNIFSKILIASKGVKRGTIKYTDFNEYGKKTKK